MYKVILQKSKVLARAWLGRFFLLAPFFSAASLQKGAALVISSLLEKICKCCEIWWSLLQNNDKQELCISNNFSKIMKSSLLGCMNFNSKAIH
jgi:hypothetical protein